MLQEKYIEVYNIVNRTTNKETANKTTVGRKSGKFYYSSHNTICGALFPFVGL